MSLGVGNMARLVFVEKLAVVLDLDLDVESGLALVLERGNAALRLVLPVDLSIEEFVLVCFAEGECESLNLAREHLHVVTRELSVAVRKFLHEQVQSHVVEREEPAFPFFLITVAAHERDEFDLLVAERIRVRKVKAEGVGGGGGHRERLSWSYGKGVGSEMVLLLN